MQKEFTLGDAVRFKASFRDSAGALFDPTSTTGKVYDAANIVVATFATLTKIATGVYVADWQTTSGVNPTGAYSFEVTGVWGALTYKRFARNIARLT
ncbi:MAG: hypothetical protein M0Z38_06725 [Deltaproteobacteria bacterium]|nr:hypothetical protein [Deltaproteobacteria bacterium]